MAEIINGETSKFALKYLHLISVESVHNNLHSIQLSHEAISK